MSERTVSPGQVYRHFKHGTLYEVICLATHTETEEEMVVYRDRQTGRCFVRPLAMFLGTKKVDGVEVKRFTLEVENGGEKT
jgi:hypothetical protein